MKGQIAGVIFDAYGTLFDVHALADRLEALFPGKGSALSQNWRKKQIDYTWLRTLSGRYADFWSVTGDALDYACEAEGAALTPAMRAELLEAYETLPLHADTVAGLDSLSGLPLAVLSNANEAMLQKSLAAAGIAGRFAHVLSVERVGKYKTAAEAYQLGLDAFGAQAGEIAFVSSNGWDVAGATWFGYRAFWVNRSGAPWERLGVDPEGVVREIGELRPRLGV